MRISSLPSHRTKSPSTLYSLILLNHVSIEILYLLYFLADLFEGKFAKNKGRPKENNISAGLKEAIVKEAITNLMADPVITLEAAVEKVAIDYPYSESFIKKKYLKNKKL